MLTAQEERDLAYRSQKGQGGVLELLQDPDQSLDAHADALRVGLDVLIRVRHLMSDVPDVSAEVVPDPDARASLQQLFAESRRHELPYGTAAAIDVAIATMQNLIGNQRPDDEELIALLEVLRAVAGYRPDTTKLRELVTRVGPPA